MYYIIRLCVFDNNTNARINPTYMYTIPGKVEGHLCIMYVPPKFTYWYVLCGGDGVGGGGGGCSSKMGLLLQTTSKHSMFWCVNL